MPLFLLTLNCYCWAGFTALKSRSLTCLGLIGQTGRMRGTPEQGFLAPSSPLLSTLGKCQRSVSQLAGNTSAVCGQGESFSLSKAKKSLWEINFLLLLAPISRSTRISWGAQPMRDWYLIWKDFSGLLQSQGLSCHQTKRCTAGPVYDLGSNFM